MGWKMQIILLAVEYAEGYFSLILLRVHHIYYLFADKWRLNKYFRIELGIGGLLSGNDHRIDAFEGYLLKVTLPPFGRRLVSAFDFLFIGSLIARRQDRLLSEQLDAELEEQLAAMPTKSGRSDRSV